MAQPIYFDNYGRQLRARAAAAPYEIGAQVIGGITQSIEQVLFDAQQTKEKEHRERLTAMGAMVNKYGFSALGSDFATQWEKDTGVQFSRGPDGKPVVPQTFEENVRAQVAPMLEKRIKENPQEGMRILFPKLYKAPPSPEEQGNIDTANSIKREGNRIREESARLHYAASLAKASKDDIPSGWTYDKESGKLNYVGFTAPSLSNRALAGMDKAIKFNMSDLGRQEKESKIKLLQHKLDSGDDIDKQVKNALVMWKAGALKTKESKQAFDALIKTWAERHGVEIPKEAQQSSGGFGKWVKEHITDPLFGGGTETQAAPKGKALQAPRKATQGPWSKMTDAELQEAVGNELRAGTSPFDIIEKSGGDSRIIDTLTKLGAQ